jgi:hypothetical protein
MSSKMHHWNYRLVQRDGYVEMVEAWYNKRSELIAWSDAGPVIANDLEDMKGELDARRKALKAPIIPGTYMDELAGASS